VSETMVKMPNGTCRRAIREDAVRYRGRWFVPTREDTKWVDSLAELREVGGTINFNEDQTAIELLLPEGYKFGISFGR
jgi:hypothetical protein